MPRLSQLILVPSWSLGHGLEIAVVRGMHAREPGGLQDARR